jgi:hypothetical protein
MVIFSSEQAQQMAMDPKTSPGNIFCTTSNFSYIGIYFLHTFLHMQLPGGWCLDLALHNCSTSLCVLSHNMFHQVVARGTGVPFLCCIRRFGIDCPIANLTNLSTWTITSGCD